MQIEGWIWLSGLSLYTLDLDYHLLLGVDTRRSAPLGPYSHITIIALRQITVVLFRHS